MKIIPDDVLEPNVNLLSENYFITVKDPKHTEKSFHYTSWCKNPLIKTLLDLEKCHIPIIENLIIKFSEKFNLKKNEFKVFIHFPPNFWRLHIHFVDVNHKIPEETPEEDVYDVYDIISNLNKNNNFYRKRVKILNLESSL